jgi:transcriptional regulator with XRE-family HTH domain
MENILLKFGKRIKELRKARNMTQEEFAHQSGFHKNYIGMIERGERNPSLKNIETFAQTFGLEVWELLK